MLGRVDILKGINDGWCNDNGFCSLLRMIEKESMDIII